MKRFLSSISAFAIVIACCLPASAAPVPLQFAYGTYGVMVSDRLTMSVTRKEYSLDLTGGQQVIITFGGGGPLKGGIDCLGGGDGPFDGSGNTFTVPRSGRCIVYLGQNQMAEPWSGGFTLSVIVVTPR